MGQTISVTFMTPTQEAFGVEVDEDMTAKEAVTNLVANNVVPNASEGYQLAIVGGSQIRDQMTLKQGGAREGSKINILPLTQAGVVGHELC
jgi:hypothetical protein